jgi:hypothetical protein
VRIHNDVGGIEKPWLGQVGDRTATSVERGVVGTSLPGCAALSFLIGGLSSVPPTIRFPDAAAAFGLPFGRSFYGIVSPRLSATKARKKRRWKRRSQP